MHRRGRPGVQPIAASCGWSASPPASGPAVIAVKVDPRLLRTRLLVCEGTHDVPLASYGEGCLPISQAFCSGERETVDGPERGRLRAHRARPTTG